MSPTSLASNLPDDNGNEEYLRSGSPNDRDYYQDSTPYNNNTLKLDNESLMMSQQLDSKDELARDEHSESIYDQSAPGNRTASSHYKDNYETTFDLDGNVETKSICSAKSGGSGHDNRYLENWVAFDVLCI